MSDIVLGRQRAISCHEHSISLVGPRLQRGRHLDYTMLTTERQKSRAASRFAANKAYLSSERSANAQAVLAPAPAFQNARPKSPHRLNLKQAAARTITTPCPVSRERHPRH